MPESTEELIEQLSIKKYDKFAPFSQTDDGEYWFRAEHEYVNPASYVRHLRWFLGSLIRVITEVEKRCGVEGHMAAQRAVQGFSRESFAKQLRECGIQEGQKVDVITLTKLIAFWDHAMGVSSDVHIVSDEETLYRVNLCPVMFHPEYPTQRHCRIHGWILRGFRDAVDSDFGWELVKMVPRGDDVCLFRMFKATAGEDKNITDKIIEVLRNGEALNLGQIHRRLVSEGIVPDSDQGFTYTRTQAFILRERAEILLLHDGFHLAPEMNET